MDVDVDGAKEVAAALAASTAVMGPLVRKAVQLRSEAVKKAWQANARQTAGKHGKHYPNSITVERGGNAFFSEAEIGPDSSKLQGGMGVGFEFGSRNQAPHLDGKRAMDGEDVKFMSAIEIAAAAALKGL